jgi:hypothetical protein
LYLTFGRFEGAARFSTLRCISAILDVKTMGPRVKLAVAVVEQPSLDVTDPLSLLDLE